jgi:hypothetical protein
MKVYYCTHRQNGSTKVFITGSMTAAVSWAMYYARETKKNKEAVADQKIHGWKLNGTHGERLFRAAQIGAGLGGDVMDVEVDLKRGTTTLKLDRDRTIENGKVGEWRHKG